MDNPTQGIDVGAKYAIYKLILELAAQGRGVLVFSTEFPEIYQIADRCIVMYKGKISGSLEREELNEAGRHGAFHRYKNGGTGMSTARVLRT